MRYDASEEMPWFALIPADSDNGSSKDFGADAFQTKSLSLARFVRPLGVVEPAQVDDVAFATCPGVQAFSERHEKREREAREQGTAPPSDSPAT